MEDALQVSADHKISSLDGLRAIAALAVFGVHFQQLTDLHAGRVGSFDATRLLVNGNSGVALFFVLSGFLLSMPFWEAKRASTPIPSLLTYWQRRLLRIVPIYYVCLTVLIIENGYWRAAEEFENVVAHYTFLFNYSNEFFYSINSPFWTIAVEMQFYVLLPIIFASLAWLRLQATVIAIAVLAIASYAVHVSIVENALEVSAAAAGVGLHDFSGAVLSHSVIAHLPHFLIGVLAGQLHIRVTRNSPSYGEKFGWDLVFWCNVVAVLLILSTTLDGVLALPNGRYNLPIVPLSLAMMIVSAPRSGIARGLLDSAPMRWIGVVSYGVYLFHMPIQKIVAKSMPLVGLGVEENWLAFAVFSLLATIFIASASFMLFERPIMRALAPKSEQA